MNQLVLFSRYCVINVTATGRWYIDERGYINLEVKYISETGARRFRGWTHKNKEVIDFIPEYALRILPPPFVPTIIECSNYKG